MRQQCSSPCRWSWAGRDHSLDSSSRVVNTAAVPPWVTCLYRPLLTYRPPSTALSLAYKLPKGGLPQSQKCTTSYFPENYCTFNSIGACLETEPTSSFETYTHTRLINETSATLTNLPPPWDLCNGRASSWGRPKRWRVKMGHVWSRTVDSRQYRTFRVIG